MGLVTVFCPFMTTGAGETVLQIADESRLVADCKVKPTASVGHVKITLAPEEVSVSYGGDEGLKTA